MGLPLYLLIYISSTEQDHSRVKWKTHIYITLCSSHVQLFVIPCTLACQAPLSIGFPRQEFWSGLIFLIPGDLPDIGIKPTSPSLAGGFFTTEPPGKP